MTEDRLVEVGRVTRPHGVRGAMKLLPGEGSPGTWRTSPELFLGKSEQDATCYRVVSLRPAGRFLLLVLQGIETMEQADALRESRVFIPRSQLAPLSEGEYYVGDLLGMQIVDRSGRVLGVLREVQDFGAQEIYVIARESHTILLPVIEGVVCEIDVEGHRMVVDPPDGLPGL